MFRVFVSHSSRDYINLISVLEKQIQQNGIAAYIFQKDPQPGNRISDKIANAINESDCVVAFITIDASRSEWVRKEIEYAQEKGIMVIPIVERMPLVEQGQIVSDLLAGIEYIPFTRANPYAAIYQACYHLTQKKIEKEVREKSNAMLIIAGIFLAIMALPGKTQIL